MKRVYETESYHDLLQDPRWRRKKNEILHRDRHRCRNCGSGRELQVHHRQYRVIRSSRKYLMPWDYHSRYLITLCNRCHESGHKKYRVPVIFL